MKDRTLDEIRTELRDLKMEVLCIEEIEEDYGYTWAPQKIMQAKAHLDLAYSLLKEAQMIAARERAGNL